MEIKKIPVKPLWVVIVFRLLLVWAFINFVLYFLNGINEVTSSLIDYWFHAFLWGFLTMFFSYALVKGIRLKAKAVGSLLIIVYALNFIIYWYFLKWSNFALFIAVIDGLILMYILYRILDSNLGLPLLVWEMRIIDLLNHDNQGRFANSMAAEIKNNYSVVINPHELAGLLKTLERQGYLKVGYIEYNSSSQEIYYLTEYGGEALRQTLVAWH